MSHITRRSTSAWTLLDARTSAWAAVRRLTQRILVPPSSTATAVGVDGDMPALNDRDSHPGLRRFFGKLACWHGCSRPEGLGVPPTAGRLRAVSGAGLRDLMARMGHDSERAAIIYQHRARGADELITNAIDAHIQAEQSSRAGHGQGGVGGLRTGG